MNMYVDFSYQPVIEDFNKDGTLKLETILKVFENSGSKHSDSAGDNVLKGSSSGKAWILTDWMIDIQTYPVYGDTLFARTWSLGATSVFGCSREFELYCNNQLCATGTTRWVLLDLTTGRPSKVEQILIEKYGVETKKLYEDVKLPKIQIPESFCLTKEIQVRRSDIDFNDHVHNLVYLDYAFESFPDDVYASIKKQELKHVRITYKTAVKCGEKVCCKYAFQDSKHVVCIYGTDKSIADITSDEMELKTLIELS